MTVTSTMIIMIVIIMTTNKRRSRTCQGKVHRMVVRRRLYRSFQGKVGYWLPLLKTVFSTDEEKIQNVTDKQLCCCIADRQFWMCTLKLFSIQRASFIIARSPHKALREVQRERSLCIPILVVSQKDQKLWAKFQGDRVFLENCVSRTP